jgi:nitrous oxidase accessory protein
MKKQTNVFFLSILLLVICFVLPFHVHAERDDLQVLIDDTPSGETLELEATTYHGDITITKPITITGEEGTHIRGSGTASVVEVEADDVTIENVHVSNSGMDQSSNEEFTGIRLMGNNAVIRNVTITEVFHGIYLTRADNSTIDGVDITGMDTASFASQGNGIHIVRSVNNTITNNIIRETRDGIYVEYANGNDIRNNHVRNTRYGLHYMYSDYNEFYDNEFMGNIGGAAIMQSDYLVIEDNSFSFNQGSRSFGLIIQTANNLEIRNNEFFLNHRGLYSDMSSNNEIEGNTFFKNQIGIELWASSTSHVFYKNSFRENEMDAMTVGKESFNEWDKNGVGNYWDTPMLDLDEDGIGDEPYLSNSALADLVEANELTYMFLNSPALGIYETMNSMASGHHVMAEDRYPLIDSDSSNVSTIYYAFGALVLLGILIILRYVRKRRRA